MGIEASAFNCFFTTLLCNALANFGILQVRGRCRGYQCDLIVSREKLIGSDRHSYIAVCQISEIHPEIHVMTRNPTFMSAD